MNYKIVIPMVLVVWNLITFIMMGVDKRKAQNKKRRISERTLFSCSFLFGGIGVLCAMYAFRHKTKHWSFRILVLAAVLTDTIIFYFLLLKVTAGRN